MKKKILLILAILIMVTSLAVNVVLGVDYIKYHTLKHTLVLAVNSTQKNPEQPDTTNFQVSSDKTYAVSVTHNDATGVNDITIASSSGDYKRNVLTQQEADSIGLSKIPEAYKLIFYKWETNSTFQVMAEYKSGKKYVFTMDASTASGDPASFAPVK
jgi:hypothetical protein